MNPKRYIGPTFAIAALFVAGNAFALPLVNSVVVQTRVFDNCPTTTINVIDNDLGGIVIDETNNDCFGFANRHAWTLSGDNTTRARFENYEGWMLCASVTASGSGNGEVGLRVSPWWSPVVDGTFMLNTGGEIAIFGGRLPFYSFTVQHGQNYVKGTTVRLMIEYRPNGLSAASPGTIQYTLGNANGTFQSPVIPFDEGNVAEGVEHGNWGTLSPTYLGGYVQAYNGQGTAVDFRGTFENICFEAFPVPATSSTWGRIKSDYR